MVATAAANFPMRLSDVHVALVDDDESVRKAVGRLLRIACREVDVYASGTELLGALEDHPPDCVVLDMYMPVMNGLDVQAALAERCPGLPVMFITAHDDAQAEARAREAGAIAFLHKPFSEQQLLGAIALAAAAHTRAG
jgi:two-component system, LuxR family, response regulator FixJ